MKNAQSLTDEELVRVICTQDKNQYRELVRRYQNKLVRYAFYLVNNRDEAFDTVQEAFINAYINLQGFDSERKFSSWIYRIVHNQAMNRLKKRKHEITDSQKVIEVSTDANADLENQLDKKELAVFIEECLDTLPLTYRETVLLFYIDGYSYEEIGEILKKPIGTVGTNISRGKKILMSILKRKGKENV